jgi:hypothetical protein
VFFVFFDRVRLDADVVEVDCAETTDVLPEDSIHIPLKCRGGVAEILRHYDPFEHSEGGLEGRFVNIVLFH